MRCWDFVAFEMRAYVSDEQCCTADYIRDLINGNKKVSCRNIQKSFSFLKSEDALHLTVPHYENLRKENFLHYARAHQVAARYLPDE